MIRFFNNICLMPRFSQSLRSCYSVVSQSDTDNVDREKKIKVLELEISMLQQEGRKVPPLESLKPLHWVHILGLSTKSSRNKYYQYLWQSEMRIQSRKLKKEQKKAENEKRWAEREEEPVNNHIRYGPANNTMFLMIFDSAVTHHQNVKLIQSMMFEQKLIIDCSYDEYMNSKEAVNAGKQLMLCFAENRLHSEPFDLHMCNFNRNSVASKALERYIPTLLDPDFPMNIHSESLTEKFDKNRLVYLTPHCKNELLEYSHDDIYVIGAMVDKTNNSPLSLAKAKKQGLRMAKLPLDRYLSWSSGSGKSLTLNQMVSIMLEMKKHGDWNRALRFVPKRKLIDYSSNQDSSRNSSQPESIGFSSKSKFFQQKQNYNNRFNQRENYSFNKSRDEKEQKHFNKFEFNLDTWGRKVSDKNSKDS